MTTHLSRQSEGVHVKKISKSILFNLPREILSLIYEYDNTYRKVFTNKVEKLIWGSALKRSLKSISLRTDSFFGGVNDTSDSDSEEDEEMLDISIGIEVVQYCARHMYQMMGFLDNYVKDRCNYGIGNDFYSNDLTAICIQIYEYASNDSSLKDNKFDKRTYMSVRLFIKHKLIFDGGVYLNVSKFDNNDNHNITVIDYDNEKRMALFLYTN
jgi:hypothetical protein